MAQPCARYVEAVWTDFPWQQAYDSFFAEYSQLCTMGGCIPIGRLEMVARCVVEMGTTTYYQTLRGLSDEPVLYQLLSNIRNDEVGHYKHFLQYFKQLQDEQPVGRLRIAGALYGRLKELRESDSDVALRHVWAHKGRYFAQSNQSFADVAQRLYRLVSAPACPIWPCACCSNPCCCPRVSKAFARADHQDRHARDVGVRFARARAGWTQRGW